MHILVKLLVLYITIMCTVMALKLDLNNAVTLFNQVVLTALMQELGAQVNYLKKLLNSHASIRVHM